MTAQLAEVIRAGMALDADEREVAAVSLQQVNAAEQAQVDASWRDEIQSRLDEVLSGKVDLIDARAHSARLRATYGAPAR